MEQQQPAHFRCIALLFPYLSSSSAAIGAVAVAAAVAVGAAVARARAGGALAREHLEQRPDRVRGVAVAHRGEERRR